MDRALDVTQRASADPESLDDGDVPAAVLCVACGRADCAGCAPSERPSRDVATPWERAGPALRRLWQTARLATVDGEAFFGGLGDGSVAAAFRFALLCELVAIGSLAVGWLPIVYAFVPGFVEAVLLDAERRGPVLTAIAVSVPALAILMVALHVLWAASLELGLRIQGAPPRATHCLRYALYSCGWDLVTSPFGFAAGCASGGLRGAAGELRAAVRIPRFATRAYLGRARSLPQTKMRRALALAAVVTGISVVAGTVALAVALAAFII